MTRLLLIILALLVPSAMAAAVPHAEVASADQPARRVPTTGYTLSMIWTPEHCFVQSKRSGDGNGGGTARSDDGECTGASRTGFILHGLWPDGEGPNRWPQYCHPVAILNDEQVAAGRAATPSAQLLQHEWAKHGSCMTNDPAQYFALEDRLFAGIHAPDMANLSHTRGLTVGQFQSVFAAANPGMRADMIRLDVNKNGWLEEVWLCLGLDKRPHTCPAGQSGAQLSDRVKIAAP